MACARTHARTHLRLGRCQPLEQPLLAGRVGPVQRDGGVLLQAAAGGVCCRRSGPLKEGSVAVVVGSGTHLQVGYVQELVARLDLQEDGEATGEGQGWVGTNAEAEGRLSKGGGGGRGAAQPFEALCNQLEWGVT